MYKKLEKEVLRMEKFNSATAFSVVSPKHSAVIALMVPRNTFGNSKNQHSHKDRGKGQLHVSRPHNKAINPSTEVASDQTQKNT